MGFLNERVTGCSEPAAAPARSQDTWLWCALQSRSQYTFVELKKKVVLIHIVLHLFFKIYFIYYHLFLAVLGLCCCAQGLLFVAVRRLLIAAASLVVEHGL